VLVESLHWYWLSIREFTSISLELAREFDSIYGLLLLKSQYKLARHRREVVQFRGLLRHIGQRDANIVSAKRAMPNRVWIGPAHERTVPPDCLSTTNCSYLQALQEKKSYL
jgi:hypothetical protein